MKPTRRWFSIHLSTAIILMFASSGLLWLNIEMLGAANLGALVEDILPSSSNVADTSEHADDAVFTDTIFIVQDVPEAPAWQTMAFFVGLDIMVLSILGVTIEVFVRRNARPIEP